MRVRLKNVKSPPAPEGGVLWEVLLKLCYNFEFPSQSTPPLGAVGLYLFCQKLNRHNAQQRFAFRFRIFKDKIEFL